MTNMTICHEDCECCHRCPLCGVRLREDAGVWVSDDDWVCCGCLAREEAARLAREEAFEAAWARREARRAAGEVEVEEDIPF